MTLIGGKRSRSTSLKGYTSEILFRGIVSGTFYVKKKSTRIRFYDLHDRETLRFWRAKDQPLEIAVLSFNRVNRISIISSDIPRNHYPLIPESSFTKRISGALRRFMCAGGSWRVRSCVPLRAITLPLIRSARDLRAIRRHTYY